LDVSNFFKLSLNPKQSKRKVVFKESIKEESGTNIYDFQLENWPDCVILNERVFVEKRCRTIFISI